MHSYLKNLSQEGNLVQNLFEDQNFYEDLINNQNGPEDTNTSVAELFTGWNDQSAPGISLCYSFNNNNKHQRRRNIALQHP
jgi:hypothetical protein